MIGDSHYGEWKHRLRLPTTPDQDIACLFLESEGQRFCVDFGYENAIGKAESHGRWATFKEYWADKRPPSI
jgi:hypothetical protein